MRRAILVLAWWFVAFTQPGGTPHVYGPFADKAQCEQIRDYITYRGLCCKPPSWCWWAER